MKQLLILLASAIWLSACASAPAAMEAMTMDETVTTMAIESDAQQEWTIEELQELYQGMLSRQGIESWIDEDEDVAFEVDEIYYFIGIYPDDPEFIQVAIFNIWPIESESEAVEVSFAVDAVNSEMKVAKLYTLNDDVWVSVEMFMSHPAQLEAVLPRTLEVLAEGLDRFVDEM